MLLLINNYQYHLIKKAHLVVGHKFSLFLVLPNLLFIVYILIVCFLIKFSTHTLYFYFETLEISTKNQFNKFFFKKLKTIRKICEEKRREEFCVIYYTELYDV